MSDYPLLSFQQSAKISDIGFFGQSLSLVVEGSSFSNVTSVLVNGYKAPTFVVLSPTKLLADQPTNVVGKPLTSVTVLKSDVQDSKTSIISFEASLPPIQYSDKTGLVQKFLKLLLTTRGSDIFSPQSGGNLLTLIGAMSGGVTVSNLGARASMYVQATASQIISIQATSTAPLAAKLRSVIVLSASYNTADTSLDIRLSIEAMDGSRVIAGLVL